MPIRAYYPNTSAVEELVNKKGPSSFYQSIEDRKECCYIRKIEPLKRAIQGYEVWITGIRREQSDNRDQMEPVEWDSSNQIIKIHPLFDWTLAEVELQLKNNFIPYNPLHDKGFPSIGCQPCTRAIQPGEDFRAGRWWWEDKKAEAIYILREVAGQFEKPALLFSGGKDSITLVHLAKKAFRPGKFPFPLVHIDTGHNFQETLDFRNQLVKEIGEQLIVAFVQDSIDQGRAIEPKGKNASRNALQTITLLDTIEQYGFDACIGGARRDEEKARAKERIFSVRDDFGQWDPKRQRPELWNIFNGKIQKGENVRVFPISNWTELDVWNYIQREKIAIPSIYFSHEREVMALSFLSTLNLNDARSNSSASEIFKGFRTKTLILWIKSPGYILLKLSNCCLAANVSLFLPKPVSFSPVSNEKAICLKFNGGAFSRGSPPAIGPAPAR
ncbi:UNVERIFIED_CONTAM: cysD [Trichonephila clavipes]